MGWGGDVPVALIRHLRERLRIDALIVTETERVVCKLEVFLLCTCSAEDYDTLFMLFLWEDFVALIWSHGSSC